MEDRESRGEIGKAEESTWPAQLPNDEVTRQNDKRERQKTAKTHVTKTCKAWSSTHPSHFPNFQCSIRITVWLQRFLVNCRLPDEFREKDRTPRSTEIKKAETFWLKQTQAEAFPNGAAEKSLECLNPKQDDNSLLRADGSLRYRLVHTYDATTQA